MAKVALITGASRGIGAAIAKRYARAGMQVVIQFLTGEKEAGEIRRDLISEGCIEPLLMPADVSRSEDVLQLVEDTLTQTNRIDVLVNNAGIYRDTPFNTTSFEHWKAGWEQVLDTNLMSAVHATWAVIHGMREHGGGKVINIASRSAFRAETTAPAYAVSKAGMVNLTRCLARAEAHNNILAYCIAPGWVETAMAREAVAAQEAEILASIPLGRIASVEDVAGVALFLASQDADYLTGITIPVAGGSWLST